MCWKSRSSCYAVFIEDSETAEILEFGIVVVCEAECMVGIQPAVVSMAPLVRTAGDNLGVSESFGHCVFDCRNSAHGVLCCN